MESIGMFCEIEIEPGGKRYFGMPEIWATLAINAGHAKRDLWVESVEAEFHALSTFERVRAGLFGFTESEKIKIENRYKSNYLFMKGLSYLESMKNDCAVTY